MSDEQMKKALDYMRVNWPSEVKDEWKVTDEMYPGIVAKIIKDWTAGASRGKRFFRIAGQSGSGKTTQLLPAVEGWFASRRAVPVLVAARRFVEYHPFAKEIEAEYGAENLRTKTNEVSTILMMLVLKELIGGGWDIILDVTLLDPVVEGLLMGMLGQKNYDARMSFVAVSREISDGFIRKRQGAKTKEGGRVVAKETASEFWRATGEALKFYADEHPGMRIVIWNVWDEVPVFEGEIGNPEAVEMTKKYWGIDKVPIEVDEKELAAAKMKYMQGWE